MYVMNGIAYASKPLKMVEVTHVKPLEDGMLLLTFNTMEKRLFDTTLLQGSAFEPLKNTDVFNTVFLENGIVTWLDGKIDCSPEYMYEHSYAYEELFIFE